MSYAEVKGGAKQLDHLAPVGCRAIGRGHAHAAEAKGGDLEILSESTLLHCFSLALCAFFFSSGLRDSEVGPDTCLPEHQSPRWHHEWPSDLPQSVLRSHHRDSLRGGEASWFKLASSRGACPAGHD